MDQLVRTLLVEDDPSARLVYEAALRQRGHEVSSYATAEDAWEACRHHRFDLALFDWVLPGMDGLELCHRVRGMAWGDQPVILIITGHDRPEVLQKALDAGADDYLSKPISTDFLNIRVTIAEARLRGLIQRKQAEEARARSESRYTRLFNAIPDAVFVHEVLEDGSVGHFTAVNPETCCRLGYSLEELLGMSPLDIAAPDSGVETLSMARELLRRRRLTFEQIQVAKDGRRIPVEIQARAVEQDGRIVVTSVVRDLSRRRETEKELKILRTAIDASQIGVTVSDVEGKILYTNPAEAEMHGFKVEEMIGRPARSLAPAERARPLSPDELVSMGRRRRESVNLRSDGSTFKVQLLSDLVLGPDGEPMAVVTTCEDISERKKLEADLRESRQRYQDLFEVVPAGIYQTDRQGNVLVANHYLINMLGFSSFEELASRKVQDGLDDPDERKRFEEMLAKEGKLTRHEAVWLRKDGTQVTVLETAIPVYDESGEIMLYDGIAEDITAWKQAQIEKHRLKEMIALSKLGRKVSSSLSIDDVVRAALDGVREAVEPDLILLFLQENGTLKLRGFRSMVERFSRDDGQMHRLGECLCGIAARDGRLTCSKDIHADPRCTRNECKAVGLHSFIALPLCSNGAAVGVLGLGSATERDFNVRRAFLEALAGQVTTGIQNALMYEKLNATVEALPDVVAELDADGRLHSLHLPHPDLYYRPPADMLGRRLQEVLPEPAAGTIQRAIDHAASTGRSAGETIMLDIPALGPRWFELSLSTKGQSRGSTARLVMVARDITERREMENQRLLLSTAIEQARDVVVITDPTAKILYVNPAFEVVTGYTKEQALGRTPTILKSGQHDDEFYQNLWETLNARQPWKGHFVNRRADGTHYEEDAAIFPIVDGAGEITHFVAIKRDITEEMMLQRRSQHACKMETLGELAGGIAHDFNNLLTIIQGSVALLQLGGSGSQVETIEVIDRTSRSAAQLTRALLAFSRQQVLRFVPLDLSDFVAESLPLLQHLLPDNVETEFRPASERCGVKGDRALLEQVLFNLCNNSAQAMPEGGKITLGTTRKVIGDAYIATHPWAKTGSYVALTISDEGIGMDEETRKKVLDPFFTTKQPEQGTGLGLTSAYGTIKQHGGMLDIESAVGVGTTVAMYLPSADVDVDDVDESPLRTSTKQDRVGEASILVVEDLDDLRTVVIALLESEGYDVRAAANGVEALDILSSGAAVDVVITDVNMPGMGGAELYRHSRELFPDLRFIFCSGNIRDWERLGCGDDQRATYLEKPFDLDQLAQSVQSALSGQGEEK